MFFQKKEKKFNLTNFFSFLKKIIRLEIFILFLFDVAFKKKKIADMAFLKMQIFF